MNKPPKEKKSYTVMFVPDGIGKTFYFKLNRLVIRSFFFFITIILLSAVVYTAYWSLISSKIQLSEIVKRENDLLKKENEKLYLAISKLKRIEKTGEYLRRVAHTVGTDDVAFEINDVVVDSLEMEEYKSQIRESVQNEKSPVSDFSGELNNALLSIPNISPVDGWITNRFGDSDMDGLSKHTGIDFVATEGSLIRATAPGIVSETLNDKYLGLTVSIDHGNGYVTRYGHCRQILVTQNEIVKRGQVIAFLGNTGVSSAPHVHYEVIKNKVSVDPLKYIFDRLE